MRNRFGTSLAALAGLSLLATAAVAADEKVAPEKLPAAVKQAVEKHFPEAKYRGAAKEVADGKTTYEVELTVDGRAVDAILSPEGKILELEKELTEAQLPRAVKETLAEKYPGAKIEKAETLTKGLDGPVRYEIVVDGKEVLLTAKGKIVRPGAGAEEDEKPSAKPRNKKEKEDKDEDEDDDDKPSAKSKKKEKKEDDDR